MAALWWGKKENEKDIHRKTRNMIIEKNTNVEGSEFQDSEFFNFTLFAKKAWRTASEKAKTSFQKAHLNKTNHFRAWFGLIHGKKVFQAGFKWRVGDGGRISICSPIPRRLSSQVNALVTRDVTSVIDLIDHQTKSWRIDVVNGVFSEEEGLMLPCYEIVKKNGWLGGNAVGQLWLWKVVTSQAQERGFTSETSVDAHSRVRHFTGRCRHDILTVKEKLAKWNTRMENRTQEAAAKVRVMTPEMVFRRVVFLMMGCFGLAHQPTQPSSSPSPENNDDSKPGDLLVANPSRIRLNDGRYLAYREKGAPKNKSKYKVIIVHGFCSSKDMNFMATQELLEELGICLLLFDRAGYGESDPNPKRTLKSEASDIEELADHLQLGSQFYVIGVSMGCYPTWSCIKRIPHRLAGAALVVPYINYKWPSLPDDLIGDDYRKQLVRWMLWVAHYTPRLLHWWLTQKLFPSSSVFEKNPTFFCSRDLEVLKNTPGYQLISQNKIKKRRVFDCLRRDFIVAFGKWDFDPMELRNPYTEKESSVHIWQGYEDKVVPFQIQRFIAKKLPWIRYHEVPDGGHLLVYDSQVCEAVLRSLLLGEDPPLYRGPKVAS